MPNPSATPTPITPPRVPIIDARTGLIDRAWYMFFFNLYNVANSVDTADTGPNSPALIASYAAELEALAQAVQTMPQPDLGSMAPLMQDNVPWLTFNNAPSPVPTAVGSMYWDGGTTMNVQMTANVLGRVAESQYVYVKASGAITKGQVCMHTGSVGASGALLVAPATGVTSGWDIVGIAAEDIALNAFGLVQAYGVLRNVNTAGFADGDTLYYNPAVVGGYTKTKPSAPNVKTLVGEVLNGGSAGGGSILVRLLPGSELGGTDSNVQFGALANNNIIVYDSGAGYWKNVTTGTGVVTALGVNTGTAGSFVVNGGALGTPSSGTVTNLTGTASININGTVGATTPTTGAFTTLSTSSTVTLSNGIANGVLYLNGSKEATSGTAITFDGTDFTTTGNATAKAFIPSGSVVPTNGFYLPAANSVGVSTNTTERMRIASDGRVGIGSTGNAATNLTIGKNITGATTAVGTTIISSIQSDVTGAVYSYRSSPTTQATSFTLTDLSHFGAFPQTFGAGSTVTNQYGFNALSNLTGATNNYGFYGSIAAATGCWNFYAAGTADNLFRGNVRVGSTTAPTVALDVTGAVLATTSIKSSGATSGIGYATGAGGTVTQGAGSGKATAVTLNNVTGQITMNNAALAADTTVTFTLTNSAIAATDLLVLNHVSGGTAGSYTLNAQAGAGSASINVRNVTTGSLSEAIVIGFAVIKAVTA